MIRWTLAVMIALTLTLAAGPADAGDAARGAKINEEKCARCHGKMGKGDGAALKKLDADVKPVDWTNKAAMSKLSDADTVKIIRQGGKAVGKSKVMPGYEGKLTDAEIDDLLAYIRSLVK